MHPGIFNLSSEKLARAASIQKRIEDLEAELKQVLGAATLPGGNGSARKRHLSAAATARISAAQKARWAKIKRAAGTAAKPNKRKARISAAGRARLAEIARARWRNAKAQGKTAL
jgi:hypothetical protein